MVLAHDELVALFERGVIQGGRPEAISGTSVDIHLGDTILVENYPTFALRVVDYRNRSPLNMVEHKLGDDGFLLQPGQFILAHTVETLAMPYDVSALLRTKSSMGRIGLEHMDAGWIDPAFTGALTLEFTNTLQHHAIRIRPGDPVGQLVFFRHAPVDFDNSYAANGRYSGSCGVEQVR